MTDNSKSEYKYRIKSGAHAIMSRILLYGSVNASTLRDGAICKIIRIKGFNVPLEEVLKKSFIKEYSNDPVLPVHVLGTGNIESLILESLLEELPEHEVE